MSTVTIPVWVHDGNIYVPQAFAKAGDSVIWEARDGVKRIVFIRFKEDPLYPFHPPNQQQHDNPDPNVNQHNAVRPDAEKNKNHKYKIRVLPDPSGQPIDLDPDLFIVPS